MFYDRQIKYLDYLVNRERAGSAGFVKLEVRGDICNINLNVNGLRGTDSFSVKVYIVSERDECELCSLELAQGRGIKQLLQLDAKNIGGTGITYQELEAVRIPISEERELYAVLEKKVGQAAEILEQPVEKITEETEVEVEKEIEVSVTEMVEPEEERQQEQRVALQDNKWKQLWEIYPHIRPFRDGREYLSIGPGDFVILPERYFRTVNNSFLLHGYYNYKHLVLKRMEARGEVRYYIGVPGNFYDREKQVAVMFGFESFEGIEEPAAMGDFGYYFMRIEL